MAASKERELAGVKRWLLAASGKAKLPRNRKNPVSSPPQRKWKYQATGTKVRIVDHAAATSVAMSKIVATELAKEQNYQEKLPKLLTKCGCISEVKAVQCTSCKA